VTVRNKGFWNGKRTRCMLFGYIRSSVNPNLLEVFPVPENHSAINEHTERT
jgi:hypothetical protein